MKKILHSAIAAFAILAAQAQTPVVNYSFEQALTNAGSGAPLVHFNGSAVYANNAKSGNGVYSIALNGSEYLSVNFSTPSGLTGYTINYWAKLGTKPNYNVGACNLFAVDTAGPSPLQYKGSFVTATDFKRRPYFEVYTSPNSANAISSLDTLDKNWHMLTFRWKKDSLTLFIDGALKATGKGPANFIASSEKLTVGALLNNIDGVAGFQSSFEGNIDEVRIYETDLSNASILSLYNTGTFVSSIYNVANDIKVGMYPNPANTTLNIKTSEQIVKAEVYNVLGSLVLQQTGAIESINVAELTQGVYVLRLTADNGKQASKKFTKE